MMKRTLLHAAALLVFLFSGARAQWINDPAFDTLTKKGIDEVYNLSFDSARTDFRELVKLKPDHPAGYFFLAMVEWWNILINLDDESRDEHFIRMLERVIDICDKRLDSNENDITALFFKGGSLGFRGRIHANREDWMKAANDGRLALPIVQKAYKLDPGNTDILLGTGIYNYYAEVIPEEYPIVKPLMVFFPSGDKKKGLSQLRSSAEKATYANVEASYFLLQIYFNYEKKYNEALKIADRLYRAYPRNVIFHRYLGRCYMMMGMWNEMNQTFRQIVKQAEEKQTGYDAASEREAQYYLGLYAMNMRNLDAALGRFYRCDELSRTIDTKGPSGFMAWANLKIGMVYDLELKREDAISQYKKVLSFKDFQGTHKQAEAYMKTPCTN
jgi:tetratricopeptide (TPR) repeat protein